MSLGVVVRGCWPPFVALFAVIAVRSRSRTSMMTATRQTRPSRPPENLHPCLSSFSIEVSLIARVAMVKRSQQKRSATSSSQVYSQVLCFCCRPSDRALPSLHRRSARSPRSLAPKRMLQKRLKGRIRLMIVPLSPFQSERTVITQIFRKRTWNSSRSTCKRVDS